MSHDEPGGQDNILDLGAGAVLLDHVNQQIRGGLSHLDAQLADGSEWGHGVFRKFNIVESDNRNLVGNLDAVLVRCLQNANGDGVGRGINGSGAVRVVERGKNFHAEVETGTRFLVGEIHANVLLCAALLHERAIHLHAQAFVKNARVRKANNPAVSQSPKMLQREQRACYTVRIHPRNQAPRHTVRDAHHIAVLLRQYLQHRFIPFNISNQNNSVGVGLFEHGTVGDGNIGLVIHMPQKEPIAAFRSCLVNAAQDEGMKGVRNIPRNHAQQGAATSTQAAREQIGFIAQLGCHAQYTPAGLITNGNARLAVIQYAGGGGYGNSRFFRNISQRYAGRWRFHDLGFNTRKMPLTNPSKIIIICANENVKRYLEMDGFPQFTLNGQVALVTAASRGLGNAIARALANAGADIALGLRDKSTGAAVLQEIEGMGRRALPLQMDVLKLDQIQSAVDETLKHFGRIDILVNNAGNGTTHLAEDMTEFDFDFTIGMNLKSTFFCSQAVGRVMMRQNYGRIVNMSSQAGFVALPTESLYCASKAAVSHLTKCLAVEWGKYNITVNAVAPTFIHTDGTAQALSDPAFHADTVQRIAALHRIGEPMEVAGAVVFLASPAASFITGDTIMIDGGWTAR